MASAGRPNNPRVTFGKYLSSIKLGEKVLAIDSKPCEEG